MNQLDFIFHGPIKHEEFNWSIQLVQNKNEYYRMNTIIPNVYYFFYNSFDNLYNKDKKEEYIVSEERASNFKRLLGGGIINNNIYPDWNTTIYHTQSLNVVTIKGRYNNNNRSYIQQQRQFRGYSMQKTKLYGSKQSNTYLHLLNI
jgi:hypothetical protein